VFTNNSARITGRAVTLTVATLILLAAIFIPSSSALATAITRGAESSHHAKRAHQRLEPKRKHRKPAVKRASKRPRLSPVTASAASVDPLTGIGLPSGPVTASDPSGAPMPVGNLPGWNQVYTDDFNTSVPVGGFSGCTPRASLMTSNCTGLPASVQSQLFAYPDGWPDTSKHGTYEPSQVLSIHDGMLDYDMHSADGMHMVSAVEPKIPGGAGGNGLQYGAYAVRFRADTSPGYKTAFLLWPDSETWPQDGEIDFPEGNLEGTIGAHMHQLGATTGSQQNSYFTNATYGAWHTAVIEWTQNECRFILDGRVIGTSTSQIPNTPMHWVLQAETALDGVIPADDVTDHVDIDWIAAYVPTAGAAAQPR
jgi:hypothetical protein